MKTVKTEAELVEVLFDYALNLAHDIRNHPNRFEGFSEDGTNPLLTHAQEYVTGLQFVRDL